MAGFFSQIAQKIIPGSSGVAVNAVSNAGWAHQVGASHLAAAERAGEQAGSKVITIEEVQIVASPPTEAEETAAPETAVQVAWHAPEQSISAAIDAFMKAPASAYRVEAEEGVLRSLMIELFSARGAEAREARPHRHRARRAKAATRKAAASGDAIGGSSRMEPMWYLPGPMSVLGDDAFLRALVSQTLLRAAFAGANATEQPASALIQALEPLMAPLFSAASSRSASPAVAEGPSAAATMLTSRGKTPPSEGAPLTPRDERAHPPQAAEASVASFEAPAAALRPKTAARPAGMGEAARSTALPATFDTGARRFLAQMALSPGLAAAMRGALPIAPLAFRPSSAEGLVPRVFAGRLGDIAVQVHYLPHGGSLVFAGWQEAASEAAREQAASGALSAALASGFALPSPDPLRNELIAIFGFGRPGGEDAPPSPALDGRDASVGERLAMAVSEQLSKGPESMRDGRILRALNAQLAQFAWMEPAPKLLKADWEALLTRALSSAIGSVPVMDRGGLRPLSAIQDDAASLLGMDVEMFYRWEDHFGVDSVAEHLFDGEIEAPRRKANKALIAKLSRALEERMAELALIAMGPPEGEIGIKRAEELELQWTTARLSMAPSAEQKATAAFELISSLARKGNIKAGRLLALIARHSIVNASPSKGEAFAPRWTQEDLTLLLKGLMGSDAWAVSSHRSFRGFLTPAENATLNALIHSANFAAAVDVVRGIDVLQVEEEDFWQALDETGRTEVFLDTAIAKMGLFKPDYLE